MSNRAQRRAAKKIKRPAYHGMTEEQKLEALFKNGITNEDITKAFEEGYNSGFAHASPSVIKTAYAAVALAAHRQLKFGRERIKKLLREVDDIIVETLTSDEAIEQVWDEAGLHLDFEIIEGSVVKTE